MCKTLISRIIGCLALGFLIGQQAFGQSPGSNQDQLVPLAVDVPSVVSRSHIVGHARANRLLHISVSLPYADQAGMESFVDSVSDPNNPNYRHYVTPEEVGSRFGLPASSVQAVTD